nr:hypothetical protein [Tanacetum cinerariifolium]
VKSTTRSRGPKSKDNTKNDRVSFASKSSCLKNKVEVKEHCMNLLPVTNKKHASCKEKVKLAKLNECTDSVCVPCKRCVFDNIHDACFSKFINYINSRAKAQYAKVSNIAYITLLKGKAKKTKKYSKEVRIATPSVSPPRHQEPRNCLRWRPTDSIRSKKMIRNLKLLIKFIWKFIGTVRFKNDHVDAIQG